MFGGKPRPKTALKAAITAALTAEDVGNGSVSELKEVIANSVASQSGNNSGSGTETMPKLQEESGSDSASTGNCSGAGFDANGYGRIDWIGSGNINSNSNSNGNISGSSRVSKERKTIDNIIVGNADRNRNDNWNGNSGSADGGNGNNGNNGISSCGIFNRIFTRGDRLLRRWLPGYNYLRDGSGNRTSDTAENESGNESTSAEVTNEQPTELAELAEAQGSTTTVRGHWNKWLSNDIYLSVGITRAEFSAHLESILKKRMFQERKKAALAMPHQ
ncbi:cell wall protein IFF6 [Drosophila pseudoobscura]|uniref:Cell wall protein IFF6 n=1 Tax=Drosophila pseudoobscura pseudoobscura TaxID=46245 RepID=A0A6I8UHI0_DROPS|nr:cell wall protein IFF6 [Drosophila pseudoobscura]